MIVVGSSLSVVSADALTLDLEADVFEVDVNREPIVSDAVFGLPTDLLSGRAQRARFAARVGVPLGDRLASPSRLTVRLAQRRDAGTDINWVWGPVAPPSRWSGAGEIAATDPLVDFRYQPVGSSISLVAAAGVQLVGELPGSSGEGFPAPSRSQGGASAGLQWGAGARGHGWADSLRPSYGHVSMAAPGWWSAGCLPCRVSGCSTPRPRSTPSSPTAAADGVSGRRVFGSAHSRAGGLGGAVRYGRGW